MDRESRNDGPYRNVAIFGGAGFIGCHLARFLLDRRAARHVELYDTGQPAVMTADLERAMADGRVELRHCDVRLPIEVEPAGPTDLVVNLAAVHREPGHRPEEYFETNVGGARNVCGWAERLGCQRIVFTSSIAPYGPSETMKDEDSAPAPETPYGESKLEAEGIHREWHAAGRGARRLVIVRPGVVFGAGEGGNVTRMIRAVIGRYFVYLGNRSVRKAGGYVKELCHTIAWALERSETDPGGFELYNFTMDPPPSVEEYVGAICRVAGIRRAVPRAPYAAVYSASWVLTGLHALIGRSTPLHPVRVRKLVRSNSIRPARLTAGGYRFRFTLDEALADWMRESPEDWRGAPGAADPLRESGSGVHE